MRFGKVGDLEMGRALVPEATQKRQRLMGLVADVEWRDHRLHRGSCCYAVKSWMLNHIDNMRYSVRLIRYMHTYVHTCLHACIVASQLVVGRTSVIWSMPHF